MFFSYQTPDNNCLQILGRPIERKVTREIVLSLLRRKTDLEQ